MTTMQIVVALGAAGIGLLIGWLWAAARVRAQYEDRVRELDSARAGLESTAAELRRQVETLRADSEANRRRVEEEQVRRAEAETRLGEIQASLEEQRKALEEAKAQMSATFDSLAAAALERSSKQFLDLARTKFESLQKEATGDLAKREEAVKALVEPLKTTLKSLDEQIRMIEGAREQAYGKLATQVQDLAQTSKELRQETGSLVASLRQPQIKGKWGELTLRRAVELAGMSPHCDFTEQPDVDTEEGRRRPDLVVHLPGGTQIVVDAKVPLHAFWKALEARSPEEYQQAMGDHARLVRSHVQQLAGREYWRQFQPTPELVVLFVPGESFFSAALEHDRTLIEDAMGKRIVLASPTTLIALLRSIAYGWSQQQIAENAEEIKRLGQELFERAGTFAEHMNNLQAGLERAVRAYNSAVGSLETRLLPAARKFTELGIAATKEIPEVEPAETAPRPLTISGSSDPN